MSEIQTAPVKKKRGRKKVNETAPTTTSIPSPTSLEWTDFILSKLTDKELINRRPTCDGLRRVFELYCGFITSIIAEVIQPPNIQNFNRATVKTTIKFYPIYFSNGNPQVLKDSDGKPLEYTYSDVADVYEGNTIKPYCNYPTATASTIAEGRCLRKAMRLVRVATHEELDAPTTESLVTTESSNLQLANEMQLAIIKSTCNKLDIVIDKFLANESISDKLENMKYVDAQKLIRRLEEYKNGPDNNGTIIPEKILKD